MTGKLGRRNISNDTVIPDAFVMISYIYLMPKANNTLVTFKDRYTLTVFGDIKHTRHTDLCFKHHQEPPYFA